MKRNHSERDAKLTLPEAFEKHYDQSELMPNTLEKYRDHLKKWVMHTGNPAIGSIEDVTFDRFKKALVDSGLAPASVNSAIKSIRAMLRRLGPRDARNPGARAILEHVPYTRRCRETHALPRRLTLDEMNAFYAACQIMTVPRWDGGPPAWWWQALCVWFYCTGMRLRDALSVRFDDIDFRERRVRFTARKTRKPSDLPVHKVAIDHVLRIRTKREFVFESKRLFCSGDFHVRWKEICKEAKIEPPFTPHDLRKTAASEINRAAAAMSLPPMAGVLLQHSATDVVSVSYLNQMTELSEAVEALRIPTMFSHGIAEAKRQMDREQHERIALMQAAEFGLATFPDQSEWDFRPFGFGIRGQYVPMQGGALAILKAIATSPAQRCDAETLAKAIWPAGDRPNNFRTVQGRICDRISTIRSRLRHALHLPPAYDPVPCIERGRGGVWTLLLPNARRQEEGAA
jgi:integrase